MALSLTLRLRIQLQTCFFSGTPPKGFSSPSSINTTRVVSEEFLECNVAPDDTGLSIVAGDSIGRNSTKSSGIAALVEELEAVLGAVSLGSDEACGPRRLSAARK
jgi:hypothetical protein